MVEGVRVLVIEDHDDSREMYRLSLASTGFSVDGVGTARAALERARTYEYDAIVCDLGLPDASGLYVVQQLRSRGLRTPVIALTGSGDGATREQALAAGFTEFCVKPCTPSDLTSVIRRVLGKARETYESSADREYGQGWV